MEKFIIYTDGGARDNPGPAGAGAVLCNEKGVVLKEYTEYLGEGTNNEAEYKAAILGLKKTRAFLGKKKAKKANIALKTDSELVAKQINGEYKIKDEKLQPLFFELWNLRLDFAKFEIVSVPREKNEKADMLANQAIDEGLAQKRLM